MIICGQVPDTTDYMKLFSKSDICLDTFPYSGTTTTCNALWMSVPVITYFRKNRHAHNVSTSLLKNCNLSELVAYSEQEYIDKTIELVNDRPRIKKYKETIRSRFLNVMEPSSFMKEYEETLKSLIK